MGGEERKRVAVLSVLAKRKEKIVGEKEKGRGCATNEKEKERISILLRPRKEGLATERRAFFVKKETPPSWGRGRKKGGGREFSQSRKGKAGHFPPQRGEDGGGGKRERSRCNLGVTNNFGLKNPEAKKEGSKEKRKVAPHPFQDGGRNDLFV